MESKAEVTIHDQGLAEVGSVSFEGKQFTANGAYIDDSFAYVYANEAEKIVTTWDGKKIGVYQINSTWKAYGRSIGPYKMIAVTIILDDGRAYHGRYNSDWSSLIKAKRYKG